MNHTTHNNIGVKGIVSVLALLLGAAPTQATETRQLTTSERDSDMHSVSINYANGTSTLLQVGQGTGREFRGLVGFDISPFGFSSLNTIIKAELRLRIVGDPAPTDGTSLVSVYRMNADWVEGNANGDASTQGATWRHPDKADTLTLWNTDGILGGPEVEGTASDTVDVADLADGFTLPPATGTWFAWDVTADVQAYVNGAATNFGWLMVGDTGTGEALVLFAARENTSTGVQPHLFIEFIPEPASTALAGLGAAMLLARRARRSLQHVCRNDG